MERFGDILTAVCCTDPLSERFPALNNMKHTHLCEHILSAFTLNPEQFIFENKHVILKIDQR